MSFPLGHPIICRVNSTGAVLLTVPWGPDCISPQPPHVETIWSGTLLVFSLAMLKRTTYIFPCFQYAFRQDTSESSESLQPSFHHPTGCSDLLFFNLSKAISGTLVDVEIAPFKSLSCELRVWNMPAPCSTESDPCGTIKMSSQMKKSTKWWCVPRNTCLIKFGPKTHSYVQQCHIFLKFPGRKLWDKWIEMGPLPCWSSPLNSKAIFLKKKEQINVGSQKYT